MLRFEMMNRLDETRDDLSKSSRMLNEGVLIVGELLSFCARDQNPLIRDNFQMFKKNFHTNLEKMRSMDSGMESNETNTTLSQTTSVVSTTSMPNIVQQLSVAQALPTSSSEPNLVSKEQQDADVNPVQVFSTSQCRTYHSVEHRRRERRRRASREESRICRTRRHRSRSERHGRANDFR